MNAFVYCRVSTEEQSTDAHYSLEYQEESARHRIKEKGWLLYKIRKDVGSGKSTEHREGYQELLRDIRQGNIDVVIVYRLDRLSRNVKDIYEFLDLIKNLDVEFVSLTEGFDTTTPMGRAMLGIAAVFAQLTRETIAENTRNGLLQRAKRGRYTSGSIKPYGYSYEIGIGLVVDPAESRTVRRIFDLYVDAKLSTARIARLLNLEKAPTKTGAEWSASAVSQIIRSPVVIGKVRHKGEVYPGIHPAIVDGETFASAQARVKERGRFHHRTMTSRFLLSGVARCARCGGLLRAKYRDKEGRNYCCKGNEKASPAKACPGLSKSARILDDVVIQRIKQFAQQGTTQSMALEEVQRLLEVELVPDQHEHDRLVLELDEIATAFTKWADRLDRGLVDEEQFSLQNARLLSRKRKVQERLKELEEVLARQSQAQAQNEAVRQMLGDFDRLWQVATLEEQQEMVRLLVEKLEVSPEAVTLKLRFGPEERVELPRRRNNNFLRDGLTGGSRGTVLEGSLL